MMMMILLKNSENSFIFKISLVIGKLGGFIHQSFTPVEDLEMALFKLKCNE